MFTDIEIKKLKEIIRDDYGVDMPDEALIKFGEDIIFTFEHCIKFDFDKRLLKNDMGG